MTIKMKGEKKNFFFFCEMSLLRLEKEEWKDEEFWTKSNKKNESFSRFISCLQRFILCKKRRRNFKVSNKIFKSLSTSYSYILPHITHKSFPPHIQQRWLNEEKKNFFFAIFPFRYFHFTSLNCEWIWRIILRYNLNIWYMNTVEGLCVRKRWKIGKRSELRSSKKRIRKIQNPVKILFWSCRMCRWKELSAKWKLLSKTLN
jgi:hypothetical protein